MSTTVLQPLFVRVSDCPTVFGISRATIYRWKNAGDVKIFKRGGASFVKVSEMEDLITGEAA